MIIFFHKKRIIHCLKDIVIDNDEEMILEIDKLILSEELIIKNEGINKGHGYPIKKEEIFELFNMEKSMCKILSGEKGSGFFCELKKKYPIKYGLFTNNHVLKEYDIEIGSKIKFEYLEYQKSFFNTSYNTVKKEIEIKENRRVFTSKELDYTCIELFESDGIINYFKILPQLYKHNRDDLEKKDIFILQFPNDNDLSFSNGKIKSIKDHDIIHNALTVHGSSGSPIIIRNKDNYIVGLHRCSIKNHKKGVKYNVGTMFDSILDDIKHEINCIYTFDENKKEIDLLHDYNLDVSKFYYEEEKKLYLEAKNINKKLFEENIELYINKKK